MYEAILNMNRRQLEELIEAIVTREVKKQLSVIKQKPVKKGKLADVKEVCRELKVIRSRRYP